jgi:lipid A 3-O-deacylase
MSISWKLTCLFIAFQLQSAGQTADSLKADRSISFSYGNDLFIGSDRYYTQGIYLELKMPFAKRSPLSRVLLPAQRDAINEYGLAIAQDVFTPYTILRESITPGERPYCAVLFLSHHLMSWDAGTKTTIETSLDLGVIGPAAMGEEMQTGIHTAIDDALPRGWKHQLRNDLVLNYSFIYEEGLIVTKHFTFLAGCKTRLGTLYDGAGISFGIKAGKPGSFFSPAPAGGFHWNVFGSGGVHAVGYNATLQGGMFNRTSEYMLSGDEISRVLLRGEAGIKIQYKKVQFIYSYDYISAEYDEGLDHGWGHFQLTVVF